MDACYEKLANAVVELAVKDYSDMYNDIHLKHITERGYCDKSYELMVLEQFFMSGSCGAMSHLEGPVMLNIAKRRAIFDSWVIQKRELNKRRRKLKKMGDVEELKEVERKLKFINKKIKEFRV